MMVKIIKWLPPFLLGLVAGLAGLAVHAAVSGELNPRTFATGVAGGSLIMAAIVWLVAGCPLPFGGEKSS